MAVFLQPANRRGHLFVPQLQQPDPNSTDLNDANCVRRPRVKGRFVKQMDVDAGLEMIKEHAQLQPPPECDMEHASDGECSADDGNPSHNTIHCRA